MKAVLTIATGLTAVALFVVACNDGGITPAPTLAPPYTPTAIAMPAAGVCQPNPDPASADVLVIDTPRLANQVRSPVTVSGQIAAFEATFKITIYLFDGTVIADHTGMSQEGQVLSPFSEQVEFDVLHLIAACLWVYQESAADGSPTQVGQVVVILRP